MLAKADASDFDGRFREIISDPLNLLIERDPLAGTISDGCVVLHNGHRVPMSGPGSYYGDFSRILIYNRGVHEPVEEFAFQELLRILPQVPVMVELGAYWAHYSMWLKKARPAALVWMVEPERDNLEAGRTNFFRNGYEGNFIHDFVGKGRFEVDAFLAHEGLETIDILHCDIQGFELEMLEGATEALAARRIKRLFVSTHSQPLHAQVAAKLRTHGYQIDVDSDFDHDSTSFDGLLIASHPDLEPLLGANKLIGREALAQTKPQDLLTTLTGIHRLCLHS